MKKITKRLCASLIVFALLFSFIAPLTSVIATSFGSGDKVFKVGVDNSLGFTVNSITVDGNAWNNDNDEYLSNGTQHTVVISISTNATTGDIVPAVQYGGNWNNMITTNTAKDGNNYTFTLSVNDSSNQEFLGLSLIEKEEGVEPGPDGPGFDGNAYLIWSCSNGGICFKHFSDIPNFDDGNSTFYKASTIKDDRTNETFNLKAQYKGWATDAGFNNWVNAYKVYKNITGDIDWSTVDPKDMLGDPIDMGRYEREAIEYDACDPEALDEDELHACVDRYVLDEYGIFGTRAQLQPLGEPTYNNSYVSYGDRNFKIVVYGDDYKGVSIGDLSELHYYPSEWANPFLRRDQFDISGTSKDHPTSINAILLEKKLNIKTLNYNDFEITSLEALDVPDGAVSVKKVNGEWQLEFSSNFYDTVVFKATDSNNKPYYFEVKRYTIDGWIRFIDNHPVLNADFYFDNQKSYQDFDLTAVIEYKDGTEKNVKLEASFGIDDGLGNITDAYEVNEEAGNEGPRGKGLKKATFQYQLKDGEDREIKRVYLNAEYKGSTSTVYAGSYVGSGKGVLANIYQEEEE